MCSIGEDDFGDEGGVHSMTKDIKSLEIKDEICKKCMKEKCMVKFDNKDGLCGQCGLFYIRHKFRAALGSSKIVKRHSNVLLKFDGSKPDVCLLDMLKHAFEEEHFKRLHINLKVIYIDEACIMDKGTNVDFRKQKLEAIKAVIEQFPAFTFCYSSIAKMNVIDDLKKLSGTNMEEIIKVEKELCDLYDGIKSVTSKQDFMDVTRKNRLRDIAKQLDCSFVFLTDIAIDLAKRLIGNIALGRGFSVANDVSFCDATDENVKFIRPIKDLNDKEIDFYNKTIDLKFLSTIETDSGHMSSIQNLASQFINGLQENYSSTVSTVYKCCNKIASNLQSSNQLCYFCHSLLDYSSSETLYAVEFSRCVSSVANDIEKLDNIRAIQEVSENMRNGNESDRSNQLCHGCRNIFTEISNKEELKQFFCSS